MITRGLFLIFAGLSLVAQPVPVWAATSDRGAVGTVIEEVLVTARKRSAPRQ
jgi:hypothetical protein